MFQYFINNSFNNQYPMPKLILLLLSKHNVLFYKGDLEINMNTRYGSCSDKC